ncbi:MAG: hypothetical protein GWO24_11930, partial [Akkermansiaceae bacterium]|nr:hypothetical protein [Akkermansiaceae bacterium]
FGYVVGPKSWKEFLHPPRVRLLGATRTGDGGLSFEGNDDAPPPRYAFLGVRSCELHAIA